MSRGVDTVAEFSRQAEPMAAAPAFRSEDVLDRILEAVGEPPVGRVLDLACGPGIVAEALAPCASEVSGVDSTPKMVELARLRLNRAGHRNAVFQVASAEHLPFSDESFDVVVTRLSLHHFQNVPEVLAEVHRVLRAGGRLVAADLISPSKPDEALLHNALERLRDPTHVRMLRPAELREAACAAGFENLVEQTWTQPRSFTEWAQVVADPARMDPLRVVMRTLAEAGLGSGLALRNTPEDLLFEHTWLLLSCRRT